MRFHLFLLGLLSTGAFGAGGAIQGLQRVHTQSDICVQACWVWVYVQANPKSYPYPDFQVMVAGICLPEILRESVNQCTQQFCPGESQQAGYDYYKMSPCNAEKPGKKMINQPVNVTREDFELSIRAMKAFDQQQIYNHAFGWSMYLMLAVAVTIGIGHRILAWVMLKNSPSLQSSLEANSNIRKSGGSGLLSSARIFWKKYIALPAFFGFRSADPWGLCSIPTRAQGLCILLYCFINLLFSFAFYSEVFDGNPYFMSERAQRFRYLAMRTGIVGTYNVVLVFAISGRNNLLLYLTGWSFNTLNLFHKWAARISILQALVHSIVYVELQYLNSFGTSEGVKGAITAYYYPMGAMSMLALLFIVPLTVRPLRRHWYETFLILHIITVTVALVGFWYHLKFCGTGFLAFAWACIGLWAGDRVLRFAKVALLSYRAFVGKANSVATLKHEGEMVRLTVKTSLLPFEPQPGTHCFVYFPMTLKCWENHPFTLANWRQVDDESYMGKKRMELTYLISQRAGMTRALARKVAASNGVAELRVLVEGPYGQHFPVHRYEKVCLIAGGSGITNTLSYLCYLGKLAAEGKAKLKTKRIEVLWIARDHEFIDGILQRELADIIGLAGRELDVEITIYLTRSSLPIMEKSVEDGSSTASSNSSAEPEATPVVDLAKASAKVEESMQDNPSPTPSLIKDGEVVQAAVDVEKTIEKTTKSSTVPTIRSGRPTMPATLKECMATESYGRTAILLCGPRTMKDDMRRALADGYDHYEDLRAGHVEYFEATFAW